MKLLDLKGLKHLLEKIVKYDKGTSDVSSISNLTVNRIRTTFIQSKGTSSIAPAYIVFPETNQIGFKAGDISIALEASETGLHLKKHPLLESIYPEEAETLENRDLFIIIADILATLKEKGIIE